MNEIFHLNQVARLMHWLLPSAKEMILHSMNVTLDSLKTNICETNPNNAKDKYYYEDRIGNYINGFTYSKSGFFEQARPLIDEDGIDFLKRLPVEMRTNKLFLQKVIRKKFPQLYKVPFAKIDSYPNPNLFRSLFQIDQQSRNFINEELINKLHPSLEQLFDLDKLNSAIQAIVKNEPLPPLLSNKWSEKIPYIWRFVKDRPENRVDPVFLLLRLLQINIYLNNV